MFWSKKKSRLEELALISGQFNGYPNFFSRLLERMDNLTNLLQKIDEKLDTTLEILEKRYKSAPIERKRKEEILALLKEKNALSIYTLSELMGLSRTRCNELLKSLEKEGLVENIRVGKKKVYRIVPSLGV